MISKIQTFFLRVVLIVSVVAAATHCKKSTNNDAASETTLPEVSVKTTSNVEAQIDFQTELPGRLEIMMQSVADSLCSIDGKVRQLIVLSDSEKGSRHFESIDSVNGINHFAFAPDTVFCTPMGYKSLPARQIGGNPRAIIVYEMKKAWRLDKLPQFKTP